MRLKPHTYRRLAWVACWTASQVSPNSWLDSRMIPAGHEIKCLKRLLSLYQTFLKEYDNFASRDPEIRKKLLESDDDDIQLLTDVFPSQSARLAFARDFESVFYISEIVRYCSDGTLDDYKGSLLTGLQKECVKTPDIL